MFEDPRCLKCRRCCIGTEMILLPSDIARIEEMGFDRSYFATLGSDGMYRLRNVGGRCVFLRGNGCAIYARRPLGCRVYPLVFDEVMGPVIDPLCPLAREFSSRCLDVELGLRTLREFLEGLERFYRYRVDWRLFSEGARKLLSACVSR